MLRKLLVLSAFVFTSATSLLAQFFPGDLLRGTGNRVDLIPDGGGDFAGQPPFATAGTEIIFGQFTFRPDLSEAYFTDDNEVYRLLPDGTTQLRATNINLAAGIVLTSDDRLLVVRFGTNEVIDITGIPEGGNAALAPVFATGFTNNPRSLLETADGRILLTGLGDGTIIDITAGGNFAGATPFADVAGRATSIVQNSDGRILVGAYTSDPNTGWIFDITEGGTFNGPDAIATGTRFTGIAVFGTRLFAGSQDEPGTIRDMSAGGLWSEAPIYAFNLLPATDSALAAVPIPTEIPIAVNTELLVASGDPVPEAGSELVAPGARFRTVGIPALNDSASFTYAGAWYEGRIRRKGVFLGNAEIPGLDALVAASGQDAPSVAGATFSSFRDPLISDLDGVAFLATLAGVPRAEEQGLFSNTTQEGLQLVAQSGKPAPGTGNATFKKIVSVAMGRTPGEGATAVYFTATLTLGSGDVPVTRATDLTLYRWIGGEPQLLMREGDSISLGDGSAVIKTFTALSARRSGGTSTSGQGHGVEQDDEDYLWTRVQTADGIRGVGYMTGSGFLDLPYRKGALTPDEDATFYSFGLPTQDLGTSGAFLAQLRGQGITSQNNTAIFAEDFDFELFRVVQTGDFAPGFDDAFFTKLRDPVTNSIGAVAFTARIAGTDVTTADDDGIWFAEICGCFHQIAREGQQAAELPEGLRWASFREMALPAGPFMQPIFVAGLALGEDVNKRNDTGFWITDFNGNPRLAIREGQTFDVRGIPKTVKAFKPLATVVGSPAQTRSHNSAGAVVYQIVFTDLSTAIVRTTALPFLPPELPFPE